MTRDAAQLENLLQFLYCCPVGLVESDDAGRVVQINPAAVNVLAPVFETPELGDLHRLFAVVGPRVVDCAAARPGQLGVLIEGEDVRVRTSRGMRALTVTRVRVAAGRIMTVVVDSSARCAAERVRACGVRHDEPSVADALEAVADELGASAAAARWWDGEGWREATSGDAVAVGQSATVTLELPSESSPAEAADDGGGRLQLVFPAGIVLDPELRLRAAACAEALASVARRAARRAVVARRRRADGERQLRLLERARAYAALAQRLSATTTLDDVAAAISAGGAGLSGTAAVTVALDIGDGKVAVAQAGMARELSDAWIGIDPAHVSPIGVAMQRNELVALSQAATEEPKLASFRARCAEARVRDVVAAPVRDADGAAIGAIAWGFSEDGGAGGAELLELEECAVFCGQAVERAAATRRAAEAQGELEALQELTAALGSAMSRREVAGCVREARLGVLGAGSAVLAVHERSEESLVHVAEGSHDVMAGLLETTATRRAVRTGDDQFVAGEVDAAAPARSSTPAVARAILPLRSGGEPLGVLAIGYAPPRYLSASHRALLRSVATLVEQALARVGQTEREHAHAAELQRSLVGAPDVPAGVATAAVYRAADPSLTSGGDWYDVIALDDGRVGIVIGDVVGHGVEAAVGMGRLRTSTRALAPHIGDPAELLRAVERTVGADVAAHGATMAYGVIDLSAQRFTYSSAGHLPPVLVDPGGASRLLEGGRGRPICAGGRVPRSSASVALPPGAALVLYTDGLIERRAEPLERSMRRLLATIDGCGGRGPDALLAALLCAELPDDPRRDDLALLAVGIGQPLEQDRQVALGVDVAVSAVGGSGE